MDESEVGRIEAWVGLDVGKADHHATVVSAAGEQLFERSVSNDEAAIERLLDLAGDALANRGGRAPPPAPTGALRLVATCAGGVGRVRRAVAGRARGRV